MKINITGPDNYNRYFIEVELAPTILKSSFAKEQAETLFNDLTTSFPHLMSRDTIYKRAKANIQFPVCACKFADDEETLISPCMAHKAWKEGTI